VLTPTATTVAWLVTSVETLARRVLHDGQQRVRQRELRKDARWPRRLSSGEALPNFHHVRGL